MSFEEQRDIWTTLGEVDPLWAILSDPARENGRWPVDDFFATGPPEIGYALDELADLGLRPRRARALDFGCGVGRATRALAAHFDRCDGVDVAPSMIRQARVYNAAYPRCHFHVNPDQKLALFADETFDFVYSNLVLQHIPPPAALSYIGEFMRVLRPGGVAFFQLPANPRRAGEPAHHARPDLLAPTRFRAAIEPGPLPATLAAGATAVVDVTVRNRSDRPWPAPDQPPVMALGNHWLDANGAVVVWDDGQTSLPRAVRPEEAVTVSLAITAPRRPGVYQLELDMLQAQIAWFGLKGSAVARRPLTVTAAPLTARAADELRRLAGRLRRPRSRPSAVRAKPAFAMYGVPTADVISAVTHFGGAVVALIIDHYAGPAWTSYLYVAVRQKPTSRSSPL